MQTRRAILAGAACLPFWGTAARAAVSRNSRLLLCRLSLERTQWRLDGMVRVGASLEARREYVRIFTPLHWGAERGFRLDVTASDGKHLSPAAYPLSVLPTPQAVRSLANYHALDAGEATSFSATLKVRDIVPAAGRYRLRAVYVPEPPRAGAPIQAIVFENGSVESDVAVVTVA